MDPFKKNQIGTTDFYLPYLGVGTAALSGNTLGGGLYGGVELDRAVTIINHAYDEGLRYFDTAPLYGTGKAEYRISLSKLPSVNRNSFIISSKVGRVIHPDTYQPNQKYEQLDDLIATNSWTEKNVLLSVEQSLKRLNLEKIDIFFQRAWSTISKGAENISPHAHDQSHISFAYYLKKNSTDANIVFLDENKTNEIIPRLFTSGSVNKEKIIKKRDQLNSPAATFVINEEEIVIFPSKTKHATIPNLTENPRISISGDVTIMLANSYGHERLMPHFNNWQPF